jgi:hypothetical protein
MAVSADQVATVRAFLSGDGETFERLNDGLDRSQAGRTAYATLITATFARAVQRRFNAQTPRSEIIDYVADVRSRSDNVAAKLDPDRAERMVMTIIGDEDVDDLDSNERIQVAMFLLAGLVADADLDEAELEAFLERSRTLANKLLG